jgi:hypothetical protein
MTRASRNDITRRRLNSQALTGDLAGRPERVVERMLALQAQDLRWGKWAVGIRAPGTTSADVDALLDSGRVVRSWPMRGTLHLVPAPELGWMMKLTTPRLWAGSATRRRDLGLDENTIERARDIAVDALSGGRELTRAGFLDVLRERGIDAGGQRGYHLVWHLAQSGTVCWGRQLDAQQMLVLLDEWVPHPRHLEHDEALGEFLLRYLVGHGPAPLSDFAWWSQLTMTDAKTALSVAGDRITGLDVDGVRHLLPAASDTTALTRTRPGRGRDAVLALPGFDEYLLGYRDRSFAIDPDDVTRVVPGKNGIFLPILVRGGRVVGTWRRDWQARTITVEPRPFAPFTGAAARSADHALNEYAHFLGRNVHVLPPGIAADDEPVIGADG